MTNKRQRSLDNPIRYFQICSGNEYCTFIESAKHYFYRSINGGTVVRISAATFISAYESYYDY